MILIDAYLQHAVEIWTLVLGAVLGSFAVATVWRLRAKELSKSKRTKSSEFQKLVKQNSLHRSFDKSDHSRCLHCQHRLAWYDLIPVGSWLWLRGKCRYCRQKIGWLEIITEISLALVLCLSIKYFPQPTNYLAMLLWTVLLVMLTILFIYDLKWMLLPTKVLWGSVAISVLLAISMSSSGGFSWKVLLNYAVAWSILGGVYWLLNKISKGRWVGDGDAYLGTIAAIVVADPQLAFVTLFLANLLGCGFVIIKAVIDKKNMKKQKIALGPLLITSLVIVFLGGKNILELWRVLVLG